MNHKFDELAKGRALSITRGFGLKSFSSSLAGLTLITSLAVPTRVSASTIGPMIELSRPNAVGNCDSGFPSLPGTWTLDDALEPFVAVNPINPKNIVATWIQGPFQNIICATSFDGGRSWKQVPIPFTFCSGGTLLGAGDERLCFASNGDLYAIAVVGNDFATRTVAVSKSLDGGEARWPWRRTRPPPSLRSDCW